MQTIVRPVLRRLADAGLKPSMNLFGNTPLRVFKDWYGPQPVSPALFATVVAYVAIAGDRSWDCVPFPCPGIVGAILTVWNDAEGELAHLFYRLPDADKRRCQEALRVLNRNLGGEKELQMRILSMALSSD